MDQPVFVEKVNVKDIVKNDNFKISRNLKSNELALSLKNYGMLEKPFLIKHNSSFYPLTCHNRIELVSELNFPVLESYILDVPLLEIFIRNLYLKIFRNECGPIGRIKAFYILRNEFNVNHTELTDIARRVLKIPYEIFSDEKVLGAIKGMPETLKNYIDNKDVPFKLIKDLILLDETSIAELNRWIEKIQIRLNIFKKLADYLFDIRRRDGYFHVIEDDLLMQMDDRMLHDYVFKVRYPEYELKKEKAEKIIAQLSVNGISVDYPEFFERDSVLLKFLIHKKDKGEIISELASGIDVNRIDELLSLL